MGSTGATITETAPYAPPATVISVIERFRETGFAGQPLTTDALARAGVSESLRPRTLAALRQLGLIDKDGQPTPQFEELKRAPGDDYTTRLAEWFKAVYASVLGFVDPAADVVRVEDAFRGYKPEGQRPRMATLFVGLAEYAGLREAEAPRRKVRIVRDTASEKFKSKAPGKGRVTRPGVTKAGGEAGTPATPSPAGTAAGVSDGRQRYVDMLLARAEKADELDPELLDRIERALGIAPGKEPDP